VGDAARQRADRFHFLGAQELLFHVFLVGNVHQKAPVSGRPAVGDDAGAVHQRGKRGAVFFSGRVGAEAEVFAGKHFEKVHLRPVMIFRRQDIAEMDAPVEILPVQAEARQRGFVDKGDPAVHIRLVNRFRQQTGHVPEPLLALAKRILRAPAVRNVDEGRDGAFCAGNERHAHEEGLHLA